MNRTSYLKFLEATEQIFQSFSDTERQVLRAIIKSDPANPIMVKDILALKSIGSQATLHGVLMGLIKKGYLISSPSKADGRIKHISTTKKTNKLLEKINTLLVTSVD